MKKLPLVLSLGLVFSLLSSFVVFRSSDLLQEDHPAKLKETDDLCASLPFKKEIWGVDYQGLRAKMDSLSNEINKSRTATCEFKRSEYGNSIQVKLNNKFARPQVNRFIFDYASRYRENSRTGEIIAYIYVDKEGKYAGHNVNSELLFPGFLPLSKELPYHALSFNPAISQGQPANDTVKVIFRVDVTEEIFVAE